MHSRHQAMYACARFGFCSADLCPLDPDWKKTVLTKDGATCLYLLEFVKSGSKTRFEDKGIADIYMRIAMVIKDIECKCSRIRCQLRRAARSTSRLNPFKGSMP